MDRDFTSTDEAMKHAFQLIGELHKMIAGYLGQQPFKPAIAPFEQATHLNVVEIEQTIDLPIQVPRKAKQIANELRTALDYAAYACRKEGVDDTNQATFPFARFKRDLAATEKRGSRDLHPEIHRACVWFKPYGDDDGDEVLFQLNDLRRVATHRMITPVFPAPDFLRIGYTVRIEDGLGPNWEMPTPPLTMPQTNTLPTFNQETKRFRVGLFDPRFTKLSELNFNIQLSIGKPYGLAVSPEGFFMHAWTRVNEVLTVMKYEAERLGLCKNVNPKPPNC